MQFECPESEGIYLVAVGKRASDAHGFLSEPGAVATGSVQTM